MSGKFYLRDHKLCIHVLPIKFHYKITILLSALAFFSCIFRTIFGHEQVSNVQYFDLSCSFTILIALHFGSVASIL